VNKERRNVSGGKEELTVNPELLQEQSWGMFLYLLAKWSELIGVSKVRKEDLTN